MEDLVIDEHLKRAEKSIKLGKKKIDEGDYSSAAEEFLKASDSYLKLSSLFKRDKKKSQEYIEKARKYKDYAQKLKDKKPQAVTGDGTKGESEHKSGEEESTIDDLVLVKTPEVGFDDIAGLDRAKERIKETIVYPFKPEFKEDYDYYGIKPGGGILFYGPPGCGKTLLAAAAAAECGAVFISVKTSDIEDKYVGETEKRIKKIFDLAREYEKAILFFDEIDALLPERSGLKEGHEMKRVSEFLAQMDSLEGKGGGRKYLILGATNRPWAIDIALRRSQRFDDTVFIPHPDSAARKKILEINLKNKPLDPSVNLEKLSEMTEGYSASDIVYICEEAARIPLRERIREKRPRRQIDMYDFEKVIEEKQTTLDSWYKKAYDELKVSGETKMFEDLIEAAKNYLSGK